MQRTLWLVWLAGCSDYALQPETESPLAVEPDVAADATVDLGIVCGIGTAPVTIANTGAAALTVGSIAISGEGYSIEPVALPATIAPGDALVVTVIGHAGEAVLALATDDPDEPLVEVALSATADAPPAVQILAPAADAVLAIGSNTEFAAVVSDDRDAPNAMTGSWTSDVDGLLALVAPADDGAVTLDWDGTTVTSGPHEVTLAVTDTCGNVAEATVELCQNAGYVEESLELSSWQFDGSATWDTDDGWLELTEPVTWQGGSAFNTSEIVDSGAVEISFSFFVSGGTGADGISVTALDTTRMTGFVGQQGVGIGYGGLPGFSVEVDTWYNDGVDPTEQDHVSVHIDGNIGAPVEWAALPELEDEAWHTMAVGVTGTQMRITIDGTVWIDADVPEMPSFPAYVGFTAATGSATNYHLIDALQVEQFVCDEY